MPTSPTPLPIVVLAGQSNASSFALSSAAYTAASQAGGMLVHLAINGSGLDAVADAGSGTWHAADANGDVGANLQRLLTQLWSILDPSSPGYIPGAYLDSVIWVQGESDAWFAGAASRYGQNLQALHDEVTRRFGSHDLIVAGLSDAPDKYRDFGDAHAARWDQIQDAQQSLADRLGSVVLVDPDAVASAGGYSAPQMFRDDYLHYEDGTGFAGWFGRHLATAALGSFANPNAKIAVPNIGTPGDDVFTVGPAGFVQVFAGPGNDRVIVTGSSAMTLVEVTSASTRVVLGAGAGRQVVDLLGVEDVQLGDGNDVVRLGGGVRVVATEAGNDTVTGFAMDEAFWTGRGSDACHGGAGDDTIGGGNGNDWLWGADGDDRMRGGLGRDALYGGTGGDTLVGGLGDDVLAGGAGSDEFRFARGDGADRLSDFDPAADRLRFQDVDPGDVALLRMGADLAVDYGTGSVLLIGLGGAGLTVDDFFG